MLSPYSDLPARAFWRSGVVDQKPQNIKDLYRPKFPITETTGIFTAGSCFAQHLGPPLRANGFNVIDTEAMHEDVPASIARQYGYGLFSARFGNIYSARQFKQLILEASGEIMPAEPVWQKDGRFYDAQRPSIEPGGLPSAAQVVTARNYHLTAVNEALQAADLVVFTFGLTEIWEHSETGTVYPTAPGTIAGTFDPDIFRFRNLRFAEIKADFLAVRDLLHRINPKMQFLLTVSPVPLTATASDNHVLVASTNSKSVLRAVCGDLVADHSDIDYFPAYELVAGHASRGRFFEDNLRQVSEWGVTVVMRSFLASHNSTANQRATKAAAGTTPKTNATDVVEAVCEEDLLEAFRT